MAEPLRARWVWRRRPTLVDRLRERCHDLDGNLVDELQVATARQDADWLLDEWAELDR